MTTRRNIVRARPFLSDADVRAALELMERCLRTGALVMGPLGRELEEKFAAAVGVKHAVAVSTGTAALEIGMRAVGVEGGEVIVPTETFVASANSVLLAGGRPVIAEVRADTLCLDLADVARKITPRTRGVLAVHMAGLIQPDFEDLKRLCDDRGLFLAEDAAHAHGARIGERSAGALGRFGCFSFYPTKLITTGEGGMLTTDDDAIAEFARSLRNHGANPRGEDYVHVSNNFRLPELSAALGLVQLPHLGEFVERRNEIARRYDTAFSNVAGLTPIRAAAGIRHSYWNYLAMLDEGHDRAAFAKYLKEQFDIPVAWPYAPPLHLQPVFMRTLGTKAGDLPQSEAALTRHVALPMHVALSDADVDYVADGVLRALQATQ